MGYIEFTRFAPRFLEGRPPGMGLGLRGLWGDACEKTVFLSAGLRCSVCVEMADLFAGSLWRLKTRLKASVLGLGTSRTLYM